jgi:glycosylphosphatidylinositol transamidase (GPIT) subunit GPI8
MSKVKNNGDRKLKYYQEELEMYKKYGLSVDDLEEKIRCLKEKNGCRQK